MPTATRPPGFPSATLRPTPSSASGVNHATSSPSSQVPTQPPFTGCGGQLNSTSGTFASPGYPFSYFNNLNCLWTLRIPTDSVLSLQFERFNTEQWYVHHEYNCAGFPSATLRPTPSSASGVVDATSSPSSQMPSQPPFTGCGGLLNSTRGTFASPGYPFSYSNHLNCLWTLRIPTDSVLSLQFERFNTEQ
ncbi:suppressor of tumorigenicity 14 protein homolog, partial [Stylophora pistillata]|uniref:suppressor of tumorigenicity 14 protein homolog n=1 Tax=Stylophora pistillata TaxID=50429 RepID=UPI000C045561